MTKTLQLLRLLSDGKARTVSEIATECGFTMNEAHRTLQSIRKRKATRSLGTPYMLTPEGMALLHDREAKRVRVEKEHKRRGRPRIHPVQEVAPRQTAPIPSVQSQPAIQQVWR
jgi:hypothetical protein